MKCKRCGQRVPKQHKDEFDMHECLCRKCWHIKQSAIKTVKTLTKVIEELSEL